MPLSDAAALDRIRAILLGWRRGEKTDAPWLLGQVELVIEATQDPLSSDGGEGPAPPRRRPHLRIVGASEPDDDARDTRDRLTDDEPD